VKIKTIVLCIALAVCSLAARAQETATVQSQTEQPVALAQKAVALDGAGREALSSTLLTSTLQGTPEAPVKNVRFVVENRSTNFYTYVSGTVTFYKEGGVRCGEGLFTLSALAPGEAAEIDAPGLRLECAPSSWRVTTSNLTTRTPDATRPVETPEPAAQQVAPPAAPSSLYLTVDGQQYQMPVNSTLEIPVRRRRVRITLSDQP
jgi:hypothetical protein